MTSGEPSVELSQKQIIHDKQTVCIHSLPNSLSDQFWYTECTLPKLTVTTCHCLLYISDASTWGHAASKTNMLWQPVSAPTHLICIQCFFSPVFKDVLFALQEADTWVKKTRKITFLFSDCQLENDLTDRRFIDSVSGPWKHSVYVS